MKSTIAKKSIIAISALFILFISQSWQFLFTRSTIEFEVLDLKNIPMYCRDDLFERNRTSTPSQPTPSFCGSIHTSVGPFQLIKTYSLYPSSMSREEVLNILHVGCKYRALYFGSGEQPTAGNQDSNVVRHTILAVKPTTACAFIGG